MPVIDHIHTYKRWQIKKGKDKLIGGEPVYKCIDKDCTHYCVKSLLLGKRSRCTVCRAEIVLNREDLRRVAPHCLNCSNTKEAKALADAGNLLDKFNLFTMDEVEVGLDHINEIHEIEKLEDIQDARGMEMPEQSSK